MAEVIEVFMTFRGSSDEIDGVQRIVSFCIQARAIKAFNSILTGDCTGLIGDGDF
jgi:hypothetical protein